jgi:hypothetical protein
MITIAIARANEALDWLHDVPEHCSAWVYNRGDAMDLAELPEGTMVSPVRAGGGIAGSHVLHLQRLQAQTIRGDLDPNGWTVFAHGEAVFHAPALLELLDQPQNWGEVQPLAHRGWQSGPQRDDLRDWVAGRPVRAERFSLHTLAPVGHADAEAAQLAEFYRQSHDLAPGCNLVAHFLELSGLHDLAAAADTADLGVCAPAGIFAVRNARLAAWLRQCAPALHQLTTLLQIDPMYGQMLERCWLHLFELPFVCLDALPRPHPVLVPASASVARVAASIDALLARTDSNPTGLPLRSRLSTAQARARAREALGAGIGLRLSAIDELDGHSSPPTTVTESANDEQTHTPAESARAWFPDLNRIGQVGTRLRENALG